jgi:Kef-type K+ transport system membrane component KefB
MLDALSAARQATPDPEPALEPRRSAVAALLGLLSVALLGASFVWAHHWGPLADAIVVAWAISTISALILSLQVVGSDRLWPTRLATRLAKIGLAGGIVSLLALAISGIAYAAGINPTGACGGG